ncbi:MAG TPA: hypothetical protein PKN13_11910 [Accumulibacter sp.]|nr:hypothetical protein [Accumulibacter sp.]HMW18711.1 hypothetical protein [Accumulibacter sp.]HMX23206.1 hypothetical protein [Accumulibacter sp.]HMY06996.1 hypothetical protein [Accumulibacter sp.]HNC18590.1 hypothetical protein [Accumulibacter sp.]
MTYAAASLTQGRKTLLLIIALLALPFAVAFALYWFEWQPSKLANHGELIQPPRPLPANGLSSVDGQSLPAEDLRRKWSLILVNAGDCAAACQRDLQQIRQVQVALNKEMVRLRRVLIGDSLAGLRADPGLAAIRAAYPDLLVAAPDDDQAGATMRTFFDGRQHRFYVVDPLGNVMMRYPAQPDMAGMLKDLERLLKYSWVG